MLVTPTSLRKVQDEDDLDEITMKRLERDDSSVVQTAAGKMIEVLLFANVIDYGRCRIW